ncbi:MAG TPA: family 16 glycoside hydrolase, partial [Bryobacteraceae bacterium]|nr:family 16 glycoside hydrolase [Bryobacteraceae bacterium]
CRYLGSYCTFVAGGWGGDIVGLSSIDEWDASENETRTYFQFEPNRWYKFRLEVTKERIRTWIDEEKVNDLKVGNRRISLRPGPIELSVPFGFASYNTGGAIRNIEIRTLRP